MGLNVSSLKLLKMCTINIRTELGAGHPGEDDIGGLVLVRDF
jgi:hypothetical protein